MYWTVDSKQGGLAWGLNKKEKLTARLQSWTCNVTRYRTEIQFYSRGNPHGFVTRYHVTYLWGSDWLSRPSPPHTLPRNQTWQKERISNKEKQPAGQENKGNTGTIYKSNGGLQHAEKPIVSASYTWRTILQTLVCQTRRATQGPRADVGPGGHPKQAQPMDAAGHTHNARPRAPGARQSLLGVRTRNCHQIADVCLNGLNWIWFSVWHAPNYPNRFCFFLEFACLLQKLAGVCDLCKRTHLYEDKDQNRNKIIRPRYWIFICQTKQVHDGWTHSQDTLYFVSGGFISAYCADFRLCRWPRCLPEIHLEKEHTTLPARVCPSYTGIWSTGDVRAGATGSAAPGWLRCTHNEGGFLLCYSENYKEPALHVQLI